MASKYFEDAFSGLRQFLTTERHLKLIKNAFYFTSEALFVLNFLSFLVGLIRRTRLVSKFMTSQPGSQTIVTHKLLNSSRGKSNQTIKFGHLIDYNMRIIFKEKWLPKCGGGTSPRPFSKKLKLNISLDQ